MAFICCGKKQKIEIANLRSQLLKPIQFILNEDNVIATFKFSEEKKIWNLKREKTGEEREKELEMLREIEKQKKEALSKQAREEEELAKFMAEVEKQTFTMKEKNQLLEQINDLYQKNRKDYLITQIKNELLKKMIADDKDRKNELISYEFNKS